MVGHFSVMEHELHKINEGLEKRGKTDKDVISITYSYYKGHYTVFYRSHSEQVAPTTQGGARKRIGEILREMAVIREDVLVDALQDQITAHHTQKIGEILIEKGYISWWHLAKALSIQYGIEMVEVDDITIHEDAIQYVPIEQMKESGIIPIEKTDDTLIVAISDPLDVFVLDSLSFRVGCKVVGRMASKDAILRRIKELEEAA